MPHHIPGPVRRFATRNLETQPARPGRVVLEQRGSMRLKPNARWLPFTAEQWASETDVAFCWHARVKMAPLLTSVVEDAYEDGHGRLGVKMWGALPLAHEEGPQIDHGEIQRYLAELPWNPRALLANPALRFEDGPEDAVRVWTKSPETYVDLHFDAAGDIVRTFSETRSRGAEGPAPWEGLFEDYGVLGGVRIPTRAKVAWLLPDGCFTYWRGEVVSFSRELAAAT